VRNRRSHRPVTLAIDDFGTGFSSLGQLKRLPVDIVKIDKSFVLSMAHDENDDVIVRSTIDLGHNLGLRVVAEGVETQETWDRLAALGCDTGAGLLPQPPAAEARARRLAPQARVRHRGRTPPARGLAAATSALLATICRDEALARARGRRGPRRRLRR
jgi:EAL domain-containing protein (putative c-di-GMP-specific phosphodiesterase class I)